jgi:predicted CXXCH cytochrome family protein
MRYELGLFYESQGQVDRAAGLFCDALLIVESQDARYLGYKDGCKSCHFKEWKSWKDTKMAQAFEVLKPGVSVEAKEKRKFDPQRDYSEDPNCLPCHTTGYGLPGGYQIPRNARYKVRKAAEQTEGGTCEACHGPGSLHVENRGRKTGDILIPETEICLACHLNIKAKFMLQHHHPVREGRMSCMDCHAMHGHDGSTPARSLLHNGNEMCSKCHREMRGPFVFEHDAVRDGCISCHNPHGSINDKLLVAGQSTTCLRCHWESAFNTGTASLGSHGHSSHAIGVGQDCIDCHVAVHGSNIWRSLRK